MATEYKSSATGVTPEEVEPGDLAIGLDFGGSGIKGAVVDIRSGQFVGDRIRIPTPQPSVPREVVAVTGGGKLKAGMFAQGEILTGTTAQAVVIPVTAVYRDDRFPQEERAKLPPEPRRFGVRPGPFRC